MHFMKATDQEEENQRVRLQAQLLYSSLFAFLSRRHVVVVPNNFQCRTVRDKLEAEVERAVHIASPEFMAVVLSSDIDISTLCVRTTVPPLFDDTC